MIRFWVVLAVFLCAGCGGDDAEPQPSTDTSDDTSFVPDSTAPMPDTMAPSTVTYHADVRPIMDLACVGCHEQGGAGPFPLTNYGEVAPLATLIVGSVTSGSMPPWNPAADCRPIQDERVLTEGELALIVAWEQDGAVEGDPADYPGPPPEAPSLGTPDLLLDGGVGYQMNLALPDDYRCFPLQHTFASRTYIRGSNVYPDHKPVVHHVLFYAVPPQNVAAMTAKDEADPAPGYQCFGGPAVGDTPLIGGWVPGMQPVFFPEDAAIALEAGSKIVMQVHYNALGVSDPSSIQADQTQVGLWTLQPGEKPLYQVQIDPLANTGIVIAEGDPDSVHKQTFQMFSAGTLIGVAPHMHLLGTRIGVQHRSGATGVNSCLVDVPQWDFNWQQFYWFEESHYQDLMPGDRFELECAYDNSTSNQPVVNGEQLAPKKVKWGDGTLDEMCLNYIVTMSLAPGDTMCGALPACGKACPDGDSVCFLSCYAQTGNDCLNCIGDPIAQCMATHCGAQISALSNCLNSCGPNQLICLANQCAAEYDAAYQCIEPHMEAGSCDADFAVCDLVYGD